MAKSTRPPIHPMAPELPVGSNDPLESAAHWVQTNAKLVGIGAAVVFAVGLGVFGLRASQEKKAVNASTALYAAQTPLYENKTDVARTALAEVASRYKGTSAGEQAVLLLAQTYFDAGEFDAGLVRTIPKSEFPPGVKVGGQLQGQGEGGQQQVFRVVKIKGAEVHLDGNHPLAGQALRFHGKVTDVRAATAEEITHRHVHGAHGHQH